MLTTCHSHGCAHEDIRVATFGVNGTTYQDRDRPPYVSPGPDRSWNYYNADGSLHLTVIRSNTPEWETHSPRAERRETAAPDLCRA